MGNIKKIFTKEFFRKFIFHFLIFAFIIGSIYFGLLEGGIHEVKYFGLASVIVFFVIYLFIYFNIMHMVNITFKVMRKEQWTHFIQILNDEMKKSLKEIMVFDDIFIYESNLGYIPIRFDNIKKVVVTKKHKFKTNKVIVKLKKGGNPLASYISSTDAFLELLVVIKAHNEDISIKFKR